MSLDNASQLGKTIGQSIQEQEETVKRNITPDEESGLLQIQNREDIVIDERLTANKLIYATNSFIMDHPVYGDIDSSILYIDGGYADESLIGWWKLDNNVKDSSINTTTNYPGKWRGTEAYTTGKQFNYAGDFDGSSSIDTQTASVITNLYATSTNYWTTSAWIKVPTSVASDSVVIGSAGGTGSNATYIMWVESSNQNLLIRLRGGTVLTIGSDVDDNTWYHTVVTWDGTTAKAYLDGTFINNISVGSASNQLKEVNIGANDAGAENYFNGQIGDVRIYNRALTSTEVENLYNEPKEK